MRETPTFSFLCVLALVLCRTFRWDGMRSRVPDRPRVVTRGEVPGDPETSRDSSGRETERSTRAREEEETRAREEEETRARDVDDGDVDDVDDVDGAARGEDDDDDDDGGASRRDCEDSSARDGTRVLERATARDREGGGGRCVGDVRGTTGDARGESGGDDEDEDDTETETETETETGARRRAGGVRSADSRERERVGGDASARGCK